MNYDTMLCSYELINSRVEHEKAYIAGLKAGYNKFEQAEINSGLKNLDSYMNGLIVGMALESEEEFKNEIDYMQEKIKEKTNKSLKELVCGKVYSSYNYTDYLTTKEGDK